MCNARDVRPKCYDNLMHENDKPKMETKIILQIINPFIVTSST